LSLIILAEISLFWKNNDGSIGESKQVVQHYGKEVMLKTRGEHVHMVHFSPDRKFVLSR
jgi:6-phosphogluconolactonase